MGMDDPEEAGSIPEAGRAASEKGRFWRGQLAHGVVGHPVVPWSFVRGCIRRMVLTGLTLRQVQEYYESDRDHRLQIDHHTRLPTWQELIEGYYALPVVSGGEFSREEAEPQDSNPKDKWAYPDVPPEYESWHPYIENPFVQF